MDNFNSFLDRILIEKDSYEPISGRKREPTTELKAEYHPELGLIWGIPKGDTCSLL